MKGLKQKKEGRSWIVGNCGKGLFCNVEVIGGFPGHGQIGFLFVSGGWSVFHVDNHNLVHSQCAFDVGLILL